MTEGDPFDNAFISDRIRFVCSDDCKEKIKEYGDYDLNQKRKFGNTEKERGGSLGFQGPVEAEFDGLTIKEDNRRRQPNRKEEQGNEKICIRCGKHFRVGLNGSYAYQEVCIYHERKVLKENNDKGYTIREYYACCMGNVGVEGCKVAKYHVHDSNKWENRTGYLRTLSCPPVPDGDYGVYAMDTEMVYTEGGLEPAHVTVTDCNNEPVYETFVRPDTKVIDYNTRFSRITAKKMEGVTTTIRDIQEKQCSLIKEKTILIGHSLECDLTAVKLIHDRVVDTAVVFPDHRGPWFKTALKTLVANYLEKTIQDGVGGHDSQEDAISCMQLMQWRVKEDARKETPCG